MESGSFCGCAGSREATSNGLSLMIKVPSGLTPITNLPAFSTPRIARVSEGWVKGRRFDVFTHPGLAGDNTRSEVKRASRAARSAGVYVPAMPVVDLHDPVVADLRDDRGRRPSERRPFPRPKPGMALFKSSAAPRN